MSESGSGDPHSKQRPSAARRAGETSSAAHAGSRRDVRDALAQADTVSASELVEMLCADQMDRWRHGERIPVEAYLQLHPNLGGDSPAAFELVYGEFMLREHLGEGPTVAEYLWRFPRFAERLQRQIGLHRALRLDDDHGTEPIEEQAEGNVANGPAIPGYTILGELGRGGMGVVYKARQARLNRLVALKVFRDRVLASPDDVRRFRREAEVAAAMRHPHVVQIHEIGEHDGYSYLALEFIAGGSLHQRLAATPQDPHDSAALAEVLSRAVHYAHGRGVIHRDLKPANILLQRKSEIRNPKSEANSKSKTENTKQQIGGVADIGDSDLGFVSDFGIRISDFEPKITDFGLAKELDAPGQTRTGDVLGTPNYMAPEQAAGKAQEIAPATDVYALGAILFEMLTGRPPFQGASPLATLAHVLTHDPIPPSRLQPGVPRDLETICLKCLHKESARRYASAEALADDLHRFLAGEPILARPTPFWERLWKGARRRPVVAALIAALVLVTVVGFALVSWQWIRADDNAAQERLARQEAQIEQARVELARRDLERQSAGLLLDQGAGACAQGDPERGLLLLARGLERANQVREAALERLARRNLAAWHGQFVRNVARFPHRNLVMAAAFSPDGQTVLTVSYDRTARLWRADTGTPIGEPMIHAHPVWCLAFSSNGSTVLTGSGHANGSGEARLWSAATGQPLSPPLPHDHLVLGVAFNPKADRCMTASLSGIQMWRVATASRDGPLLRHPTGTITGGDLSPDGKTIVTAGEDKQTRLWDALTGQQRGAPMTHEGVIQAVAFSPDSHTVATGGDDKKTRLWDVATGRQRGATMTHRGMVKDVAFSPDGRLLATGGIVREAEHENFGEARVWDTDGHPVGPVLEHPRPVWTVALSPDATLLMTGSEDGGARLFRVSSGAMIGPVLGHEGTVRSVAFSSDGKRAVTASAGGDGYAAGRLWQIPSGMASGPTIYHRDTNSNAAAFSPDGNLLATAQPNGLARFWDPATGRAIGKGLAHPKPVEDVQISADGQMVLTVDHIGTVRLWDRAEERLRHTWPHPDEVRFIAFSPDGSCVLTGTDHNDRTVRFWDTATGKAAGPVLTHPAKLCGAGFADDGQTVWTAAADDTIRRWDRHTGALLESSPAPATLHAARFGPSGHAALTFGWGRYLQLRDLTRPREPGLLCDHPNAVLLGLAFSGDGLLAATVGNDRTCRLWDTAAGKPVGPPLPHHLHLASVALRPDGRMLAIAGHRMTSLHEIPAPIGGSVQQVRIRMELETERELDEQGRVRPLSAAQLQQRRQELDRQGGPPTPGN